MKKLKAFVYGNGQGGFGDFIKSLKIYIEYSIKNNNRIVILIDNQAIKNYIIIKKKYKYRNETYVKFLKTHIILRNKDLNKNDKECKINLLKYIDFNKSIYDGYNLKMKQIDNIPYDCIHIRLGDKYGNKTFPSRRSDRVKGKNIDSIIKNIKKNNITKFIIVSDNKEIKNRIADKYNLTKFDINILHLDGKYIKNVKYNENDIIDNLIDYIILSKAKNIHSIGFSSFSLTANWIFNNKIINY